MLKLQYRLSHRYVKRRTANRGINQTEYKLYTWKKTTKTLHPQKGKAGGRFVINRAVHLICIVVAVRLWLGTLGTAMY